VEATAELNLLSDIHELGRVRRFVRAFCQALPHAPFDDDNLASLELAVTEVCSNIIKHAYHGQPGQPIYLQANHLPGCVTILLRHSGEPLDTSKVATPAFDGSRQSGFGIYLIAQCVDEVRYYSDEEGKICIALTKTYKK
jgi:anti-sigma regulatory factor (Ser/Thr protein kinase)